MAQTDYSVVVDDDGKPLLSSATNMAADENDLLFDRDWAKTAFLLPDEIMATSGKYDIRNRYWSTADKKYTDSTIGGNFGINAKPQFTQYADVPCRGRIPGRVVPTTADSTGNYGLGRYYSEALDDNEQLIYMRFGVPQHSALMTFFNKAFDANSTSLARTGRFKSLSYKAGEWLGIFVAWSAFPAVCATLLVGRTINMFFTKPSSKYYTLKPTMHLYWSAVNGLVNAIATNMGILPPFMMSDKPSQTVNREIKLSGTTLDMLQTLLPDIIDRKTNSIDVFAAANRAQRLANMEFETSYEKMEAGDADSYVGLVEQSNNMVSQQGMSAKHGLASWLNHVLMNNKDIYADESENSQEEIDPRYDSKTGEQVQTKMSRYRDYFDAEWRDGGAFAMFRVDHTGVMSENFSSAVTEADIANKFNGMSSTSREARFSLGDGNLGDGVVANAVEGAVGMAKDVAMGALDGMTMGLSKALGGLLGNGYLDIPKHWQSSTAQLTKASYKVKLISPYNNPISYLQNIIIPLCMLMASAMPRSTGKQSYTSPFLCQLYDRGRCQVQLGIVDSLSISRGTSNLSFSNRGRPLAIDVTFSVTDLSSIMHMPLTSGSIFGADQALDDDNILRDYLAVLAGQDVYSQIYAAPKAKLAFATKVKNIGKLTSAAYWASYSHDLGVLNTFPVSILSGAYEAMLPGAAGLNNDATQ